MDFEENKRDLLPIAAAVLIVLMSIGGGLWWLVTGQGGTVAVPTPSHPAAKAPVRQDLDLVDAPEASSEEVLQALGVRVESSDASEVANGIAKLLSQGNFESAGVAIDGSAGGLSTETLLLLRAQAGEDGLRLKTVREVGELEINQRKRFAIEFEEGASPLFLDLTRGEGRDGKWSIESVEAPQLVAEEVEDGTLPPMKTGKRAASPQADSLTVSDQFLQATLNQDFAVARKYVAESGVSNAKIAALCILFEEGQYRLNSEKPLRALFTRETAAGYLANVVTDDGEDSAQFGVNLIRKSATGPWQISEINLDALLADYAGRVAGGDVYYTPLVPNPKGGETLVIFFAFDEETLAPRTARQLAVVAEVLRTDPDRKLTVSGHADALGSDDYNRELSRKRASTVRDYLIRQGVNAEQVRLEVAGESRPRRPNETATGEDNPEGRRANRRTEIYLDF